MSEFNNAQIAYARAVDDVLEDVIGAIDYAIQMEEAHEKDCTSLYNMRKWLSMKKYAMRTSSFASIFEEIE